MILLISVFIIKVFCLPGEREREREREKGIIYGKDGIDLTIIYKRY